MATMTFMYHLTLTYYNNTNCSMFLNIINNISGTCDSNQNNYECCNWVSNEKNITLNNCEESEMWTCTITDRNNNDIYGMVAVSVIAVLCVIVMSIICCAIFNKHKSHSGYTSVDNNNRINGPDYTANDPYSYTHHY